MKCKCKHECGKTWVPTYCNHGHCAVCFRALDSQHECDWNGTEHPSYGPSESLPGNVTIVKDN